MNPNKTDSRRISALRDLPQALEPPALLWSRIEAQLTAEPQRLEAARHRAARVRLRALAVAAIVAALAVGILIGRSLLPVQPRQSLSPPLAHEHPPAVVSVVPVAYVNDPRYLKERAALLRTLQSQLASLPPDTRTKVLASLATIHKSMRELEAALGRDPSNALLQELLVNTYQDEMRVLTTVHEVGQPGEGI